jgi:hypothetical protein
MLDTEPLWKYLSNANTSTNIIKKRKRHVEFLLYPSNFHSFFDNHESLSSFALLLSVALKFLATIKAQMFFDPLTTAT